MIYSLSLLVRKNLKEHIKDTLLDGEMVIDMHEGKPIPRYLIYDIIRFKGNKAKTANDASFELLRMFGFLVVAFIEEILGDTGALQSSAFLGTR